MELKETRLYVANNVESFNSLGAFLLASSTGVYTFHASEKVISLTTTAEDIHNIGCFIDNEGLDFGIGIVEEPTTADIDAVYDSYTTANHLRIIIKKMLNEQSIEAEKYENTISEYCKLCNDLTDAVEEAKKQGESYKDYWLDANNKIDLVKKQVEAISVIMQSIFPS